MAIEGDLSAVGLAEVFQMLSMGQKEGTLIVRGPKETKRIFFGPDGVSLLTRASGGRFRIGEALMKQGYIDAAQLQEALDEQKSSSKRLGQIMIEKGWIEQQHIDWFVRQKLEDEIYGLFLWRDATFKFEEGPLPDTVDTLIRPTLHLKFDVNALLLEALRRVDEWSRINGKVGGLHCVYRYADDAAREAVKADPGEADAEIAALVDGTTSLGEIQRVADRTSFDVCKTALALIDAERVVEVPTAEVLAMARERDAAGDPEAAVRLYRAVVHSPADEGGDVEVVSRCAELCAQTGVTDEALLWYGRLASAFRDAGETASLVPILENVVALDPDNVDTGMELFELYISGQSLDKGRALGDQLLKLAQAKEEMESARDIATKLAVLEPRNLDRRLTLIRILAKLGSDSELREELRFVVKNLRPGDPEHEPILEELRGISPDFFREEYLPPESKKKKAKKMAPMLIVGAVVAVVAAVTVGVMIQFLGPSGNGNPNNGNNGMGPVDPPPVALDKTQFEKFMGQFEESLKAGDVETAGTTLTSARSLADNAKNEAARATCRAREGELKSETEALQIVDDAAAAKRDGDVPKAADCIRRVLQDYGRTHISRRVKIPVAISAEPAGVKLVLEGREIDLPTVLDLDPLVGRLTFRRPGFADRIEDTPQDRLFSGRIAVRLQERSAAWEKNTGKSIEGDLLVVGRVLFVPTKTELKAYEAPADRGGGLPAVVAPGGLQAGPAGVGTTVVFTDAGRKLHAYRVPEEFVRERVEWSPLALSEDASAVLSDGDAVAVVLQTTVARVDLATGTMTSMAEQDTEHPIVGRPVLTDGAILFARSDGKLYGYDRTGARRFEPVALPVATPVQMAASGARVAVVSADGQILGYDARTGELTWRGPKLSAVDHAPAFVGDELYVALRNERVVVLDWNASALKKTLPTGLRPAGPPIVRNGRLIAAGEDGSLRVIDVKTLELLWSFSAGEKIRLSPAVSGSMMYVPAGTRVFAVELD